VIYLACQSCDAVLRVCPGEEGEIESLLGTGSEWYPDRYPCPRCTGKCAFTTIMDPLRLAASCTIDLKPQEAFVALCGAGLPEEHDCGSTAVEQLFTSKKVTKVSTRQIRGSNRCVLDVVEFEDGTVAYLGSSTFGATIFRISKPHSYTKAVP
jgi:hypothetical protein